MTNRNRNQSSDRTSLQFTRDAYAVFQKENADKALRALHGEETYRANKQSFVLIGLLAWHFSIDAVAKEPTRLLERLLTTADRRDATSLWAELIPAAFGIGEPTVGDDGNSTVILPDDDNVKADYRGLQKTAALLVSFAVRIIRNGSPDDFWLNKKGNLVVRAKLYETKEWLADNTDGAENAVTLLGKRGSASVAQGVKNARAFLNVQVAGRGEGKKATVQDAVRLIRSDLQTGKYSLDRYTIKLRSAFDLLFYDLCIAYSILNVVEGEPQIDDTQIALLLTRIANSEAAATDKAETDKEAEPEAAENIGKARAKRKARSKKAA